MAKFAVELEFGPDQDARTRARPAHREYSRDLAERGVLLAGGPFTDDTGALLVYEVTDEQELSAVLHADPYTAAGVIARTHIREWNAVTGTWVAG